MGEGGSECRVMAAPDGRTVGAKNIKSNKSNRAAAFACVSLSLLSPLLD